MACLIEKMGSPLAFLRSACVVDSRVHGGGPKADVLEHLPGALSLDLACLGGLNKSTTTSSHKQRDNKRG